MAIVSTQKGRQAFISNRGIHFLCEINVSKIISFRHLASCHDAVVDIVIIVIVVIIIIIMQVKQTFQCEDALKLLLNILTIEGA